MAIGIFDSVQATFVPRIYIMRDVLNKETFHTVKCKVVNDFLYPWQLIYGMSAFVQRAYNNFPMLPCGDIC